MLNAFRLAAVLCFSLALFPQEAAHNQLSGQLADPCVGSANKEERTACWQELARKAQAYLADDPCPNASTDMARTNCWLDLANQANDRLASYYQTLQKTIKAHRAEQPQDFKIYDDRNLEKLTAAQIAWSRYRDAQCTAAEQRYAGGTIAPSIRAGCERDLADRRIEELHQTYASYLVAP